MNSASSDILEFVLAMDRNRGNEGETNQAFILSKTPLYYLRSKILVPFAIWHGSGARMALVFWNKIEERLFRGAGVATIYVSFQQVPLVELS